MIDLLIGIAAVAGVAAAGVALGLLAMRLMRGTRRGGAFALASAMVFSFGIVNSGSREALLESDHAVKRKKDPQSDDPPEPD